MVMKQADEIAGAPTIGGAKVMGAGTSSTTWVGASALARVTGKTVGPSPLGVGQLGFLTVTAEDLFVLNFKHGAWHPTATGVIAVAPRSLVAAVEISKAVTINSFVIGFTTGEAWHLQADKVNVGKVRKLAAELGFG